MIKLLFKLSPPKFSVGGLKKLMLPRLSSPSFHPLSPQPPSDIGDLKMLRFPTENFGNDIFKKQFLILSLLLITLTNCITIAKRTEYLEAPILVKPFTCSSYEGYEADYIDCRFKTLTEAYLKRKRFLEEQAEQEADPKNKKQILLVISETDRKIKSLESWQASSLPGAKKRDEKWQAEEAKRQAEADRLARIEKLRLEKEEREQELAEMRRTGKKNASECTKAKSGLQDCIQSAKMGRQGAQVFGAITGINTSAIQDLSSNVELACKTFKATITIACAFAGESDFAEVMSEIQVLDKEIKAAEKRR